MILTLAQAKITFNSMVNQSTSLSPFAIVYTKVSNSTVDLIELPNSKNKLAERLAEHFQQLHQDIKQRLEAFNAHYKAAIDKYCREKLFKEGDLVMIHLNKFRYPSGTYHKLQAKKIGSFLIKKKLGDNAYVIGLPSHLKISNTSMSKTFLSIPPLMMLL